MAAPVRPLPPDTVEPQEPEWGRHRLRDAVVLAGDGRAPAVAAFQPSASSLARLAGDSGAPVAENRLGTASQRPRFLVTTARPIVAQSWRLRPRQHRSPQPPRRHLKRNQSSDLLRFAHRLCDSTLVQARLTEQRGFWQNGSKRRLGLARILADQRHRHTCLPDQVAKRACLGKRSRAAE